MILAYITVSAVLALLSIIVIKWLSQRDVITAATADLLESQAALHRGQASHEHAQADHVQEQRRTQRCNTDIGSLQIKMQENTLRLQCAQVDSEIAKLNPPKVLS